MRSPRAVRRIVAGAALLLALAPVAKARACIDTETAAVVGAVALLTPGDIGVAVPASNASAPRLVLSWSWQIPISPAWSNTMRHRIVPEVDLLPHSGGVSGRGRLGYRYGRRHAFAGAGISVDGAGPSLSPELGVKFLHADEHNSDEFDASLHLLARAEIAPDTGHIRGATVLLGWNLY